MQPLTKLLEHLQTSTSAVVGSNLINVWSQIKAYSWEKSKNQYGVRLFVTIGYELAQGN